LWCGPHLIPSASRLLLSGFSWLGICLPAARVVTFEPNPTTRGRFARIWRCRLPTGVIVIEKGVYDRVGMLTFEQGADSASCSVRVVSDAVFLQPCRLTMKLIQIGAKGDVQPFETG
jgi:hypothetical protein